MITVPSILLNLNHKSKLAEPMTEQNAHILFVVSNRKLKMTRDDTSLLMIAGSISSKFKYFCTKVLKDSSEIYLFYESTRCIA